MNEIVLITIMLQLTGQNFVQIQRQYQIEKSIKSQHENSSYYEVLVVWRIWMDVRIHIVVQMDKLEKEKKRYMCGIGKGWPEH